MPIDKKKVIQITIPQRFRHWHSYTLKLRNIRIKRNHSASFNPWILCRHKFPERTVKPSVPLSFILSIIAFFYLLFNCVLSIFAFIIISFFWVFFTPVLAGFPLKSEWQQVYLSLQDSSQCSGWSQQCCSLDCLHSSSYFQVLQSLY